MYIVYRYLYSFNVLTTIWPQTFPFFHSFSPLFLYSIPYINSLTLLPDTFKNIKRNCVLSLYYGPYVWSNIAFSAGPAANERDFEQILKNHDLQSPQIPFPRNLIFKMKICDFCLKFAYFVHKIFFHCTVKSSSAFTQRILSFENSFHKNTRTWYDNRVLFSTKMLCNYREYSAIILW